MVGRYHQAEGYLLGGYSLPWYMGCYGAFYWNGVQLFIINEWSLLMEWCAAVYNYRVIPTMLMVRLFCTYTPFKRNNLG